MNDRTRSADRTSSRFTRQGDGVIVDHERGFDWFALAQTRNWDALMLEPFAAPGDGWRVPTRAELQTLVAKRKNADQLLLDPAFEGLHQLEQVWTDDWSHEPRIVWSFNFGRGKAVEDWDHPTHHLGVLIVRARR
jgi:hypothetical protein